MKQKQTDTLPGIFDVTSEIKQNHLYYGDNLTIMRNMPNACVDLIYLDPPFNSQRNYNLIYKKLTGLPVPEQEEAFCDAWVMDAEKEEMARNMPMAFRNDYGADDDLVLFWQTWINALRHSQPRLLAYLIYMSYRLFEMRRILKPTGSLYLHCDPTASHYIKVILDGIFGHQNFRNEIVWKRTYAHNDRKITRFGSVHDTIFFYSKSDEWTFNKVLTERDKNAPATHDLYRHTDGQLYRKGDCRAPGGRGPRYEWNGHVENWRFTLEESKRLEAEGKIVYSKNGIPRVLRPVDLSKGSPIQDVWVDVDALNSGSEERLGYPTQKPRKLLERIIQASSNPEDVVFDPFCGCGTAIYAAHLSGRKWIGCDIAILSIQLVRDVLFKRYGLNEGEHFKVSGVPLSLEGAQDLFQRDKRQFQHWAVELAGGFSSAKHSGDQGIDGRIHYETHGGLKNMVISVKGGKLAPAFVRELRGVLERERDCEMAGFICLQEPTSGMLSEAASAGTYNYLGQEYQRLQIRTIQELLDGKSFDTPSKVRTLNWVNQIPLPI